MNGEEAARLYANTSLVHAVILDFHMEGSSGLEGARRIRDIARERGQRVKLILVSGSMYEGEFGEEFDAVFEKPVNWDALVTVLEREM